jgi:site-specific recombinase XerD
MLNLFRWHTKKCPHDSRQNLKCQCPIWIDWTMINGQRVRKSLGIRDWQAAQRRARDMEADRVTVVGEAVTVEKAVSEFEKDAETNVTPRTLRKYKILLKRLNAFCKGRGLIFLKQVTVVEVRDFRNGWTQYSPRTAGKHIERLKRFFNWCVENQWMEASPAKPLRIPKAGETDVVPFSEEEIGKILKACDQYEGPNRKRLRILTDLMLESGLRISDAVMISKDRIVKTPHGYAATLRTAKTGTAVSCPLPDKLAKAILSLEGKTPFWSGTSDVESPAKNWRKIYARVFKAAGVVGHPHQFRHTTAKRLLVNGVPITVVATLLGNTEKVCRENYAKWIPERQDAFEASIRQSWRQRA